jgi:hypothetical protein
MSGVLHMLRHMSWVQRLVLLVLGTNSILILLGPLVVPSTLTSAAGVGAMLGAAGLQIGLALVVLVGPLSFDHYQRTMVISLGCGVLFAAAYLGILGCEFAGIQLSFDTGPGTIYTVFVGAALLAGAGASARTRWRRDGVVAAVWALVIGTAIWSTGMLVLNYTVWGSHSWYQFWQGDGAIDDFRHSRSTDLAAFLLQDLQGALFFHQVLSAIIGVVSGVLGGSIVLVPTALWRLLRRPTPTRA